MAASPSEDHAVAIGMSARRSGGQAALKTGWRPAGEVEVEYKAFISYSHAVDGNLAPALQTGLQQFAKPWYQLRAMRVFRDAANLSATPALWSSIEKALKGSEFFILIASDQAAQSKWVQKEVQIWRQCKSPSNILIVLLNGVIAWDERLNDFDWARTTALPEALRGTFTEEPLWVDLRGIKVVEQLSLRHAEFRDAIASISATLQKRSKEDLDSLDLRLHRKAVRIAWLAGALLTASTIIAVIGYRSAIIERNTAVAQRLAAQSRALIDSRLDLALLLSLEANRIGNDPEIRGSLLDALNSNPNIARFLQAAVGGVRRIAYAPGGKLLAVAGTNGTIKLFDPRKREWLPLLLAEHKKPITSLSFSASSRYLVSGDQGGLVTIWSTESFKPVKRFSAESNEPIGSAAVSPDETTLAIGSADSKITLWNLRTGEPLFPPLEGHDVGRFGIFKIAFSPDGRTLATAGFDTQIILWDVNSGKQIGAPLNEHALAVTSLVFTQDGSSLISGGLDNKIVFWNLKNSQPSKISQAAPQKGGITDLALYEDENLLASASNDGSIVLWDLAAHEPTTRLSGQSGPVNSIAFSPDARAFASGSEDGTVILWDLTRNQRLGSRLRNNKAAISAVAFSPDNQFLLTSNCTLVQNRNCARGEVSFWDVATGRRLQGPDIHADALITDLSFSPDGKTLATADFSGNILFWAMSSGNRFYQIAGDSFGGMLLRYSPDGHKLGAVSITGMSLLWDVRSFPVVNFFMLARGAQSPVYLAFSPDGHTVATAASGAITFWDAKSGRALGKDVTEYATNVSDITFSPDSKTLALASGDGTVTIWDVERHRAVGPRLTGHTGGVTHVAFSPDGKLLVSSGVDATIKLWETSAWQYIGSLTGHEGRINSLAFSPDGRYLASGSDDRTVILWRVSWEHWKELACRIAGRNLTESEWKHYLASERYHQTCPTIPSVWR